MDDEASPFVRAFVAIEISQAVREKLTAVQSVLKKAGAHVGWVRGENIHLSLAFLGALARDTVPLVAAFLDEAAEGVPPFDCRVAGVGTFRGARKPRVVWARADPNPVLMRLQERVATAARDVGIPLPEKPFIPHLTLGRVRSARGRDALLALLDGEGQTAFGDVPVTRVVLMQSELEPAGAQYTVLHATPLCGTPIR